MGSASGIWDQLHHDLDQLSALLERLASPRLDLVRLLVSMARQQLHTESFKLVVPELEQMPPEVLRPSLRQQGAMATAQFIESLRASEWTDAAILGLLACWVGRTPADCAISPSCCSYLLRSRPSSAATA